MAKLTQDGRGRIAEKMMEVGNLTFLGLAVSQFVPGPSRGISLAVIGLMIWLGAYSFAFWLLKGGGKS
jgi:hypothetical protein